MKNIMTPQLIEMKVAGACGNRTHPAGLWPATPDLKSGRDTRALCTPKLYIKPFAAFGANSFFSTVAVL